MKKLIGAICVLAFAVACSGSDDANEGEKKPTACSADCNGALAAAPNLLCAEYNGTLYESGVVACSDECAVDTAACIEISNVGAAEFQQCSGASASAAAQGTCAEDMHCLPFLSATTGYCLQPCTTPGADAACGEGTCVELTGGNYCFKQESQRDTVCFENLSECVADAGECTPTGYDYDAEQGNELRCKTTCDGGTIGTQGSCAEGETCLQNTVGWLNVESETECADDAACGEGYECMDLSSGKRCAQYAGWCGNTVGLCGSLGQAGIGTCARDQSKLCTPDNGHQYCGITGAADDAVEAAGDAYPYCMDIGGGFGVCVGLCETDEGNANCGDGFECVMPADGEELFFNVEKDAQGADLTCTDDTTCAEGFKCNNLSGGMLCSKPYKLCKEAAAAADNG